MMVKVLLVLCMTWLGSSKGVASEMKDDDNASISVMDYGAVGDGLTDDSQSFLKAWEAVCKGAPNILNVPGSHTFLLKPLKFKGPCNKALTFNIYGTIVAPSDPDTWDPENTNKWVIFDKVAGLSVTGTGIIDGQGSAWWKLAQTSGEDKPRPDAFSFTNCQSLQLHGLRFINSSKIHVAIDKCTGVVISSVTITAPHTSPNTDGIDIAKSSNVQIRNCDIGSGDDCVAIGGGTSFVNISGLTCGPGHGISIGSLGRRNQRAEVEEIHVSNCNMNGTTNGARIKTWQGGSGFARKISFENITFYAVAKPIIIDQYYCDNNEKPCPNHVSSVAISNITYNGLRGTTITRDAIQLKCSQSVSCTNIVLKNINITSVNPPYTDTRADCINARGSSDVTFPAVDCLSQE